MAKTDTGGPAYPNFSYEEDDRGKYHPGMTLLEHYAGLAMQTVIGIRGEEKLVDIEHELRAGGNEAKIAYRIAEAMIAEKRRREE